MRIQQYLALFILPILIVLFIFKCAPTQEDSTKIREAIMEANTNFMAKFNEGDAAGVPDGARSTDPAAGLRIRPHRPGKLGGALRDVGLGAGDGLVQRCQLGPKR